MNLIENMFQKAESPIRAWLGPVLVVGISKPEDMQTVLTSTSCLQKGYMYKFTYNLTGIFSSDGESLFYCVWYTYKPSRL